VFFFFFFFAPSCSRTPSLPRPRLLFFNVSAFPRGFCETVSHSVSPSSSLGDKLFFFSHLSPSQGFLVVRISPLFFSPLFLGFPHEIGESSLSITIFFLRVSFPFLVPLLMYEALFACRFRDFSRPELPPRHSLKFHKFPRGLRRCLRKELSPFSFSNVGLQVFFSFRDILRTLLSRS